MPLSGKYLNFISVKLPLFSLAITSHEGKGPAVLRWLRHLFMHSGPLLMPVGQGHKLLEAGKWFKLIFSRLAKPFNLVLWDTTRTCCSKNLRLLKLGKGVQASLTRLCLEEFCWLGFINSMWEKKSCGLFTHKLPSSVPTSNGSSPPSSHFQPLGWKPTFSRILFPRHISTVYSLHNSAKNIVENTMKIKKCMSEVIFLLKFFFHWIEK